MADNLLVMEAFLYVPLGLIHSLARMIETTTVELYT